MARKLSFWSERKAIPAAGGIITWSGQEIDTDGLVAVVLSGSGVGSEIASTDLAQFRVKGSRSGLVVDLNAAELRGFVDAYSGKTHSVLTTEKVIVIPLNMPDIADPDMADRCGWPIGDTCTIEVLSNDAVGGGFIKAGFIRSTIVPDLEPRIIGSAMNIGASQSGAAYKFEPPAGHVLRGIAINNTELTRLQLIVGGETYIDTLGLEDPEPLMVGSQMLNGIAQASVNVDPTWLRTPNLNISAVDAKVRLDTGNAWAAANRLAYWSVGKNSGRR